jgi:hypothetical protein
MLRPIMTIGYSGPQIRDREITICEQPRRFEDWDVKYSLFPDDNVPAGDDRLLLSQEDVQDGLRRSGTGLSADAGAPQKGHVAITLLICIDYQFSFAPGKHHTRYTLQLADPVGEARGPVRLDFNPEGDYPKVVLLYESQSAD